MVVSSGATVAVVLPSIVEWLFFSKIIIKIFILHSNSQKLFTIFQKHFTGMAQFSQCSVSTYLDFFFNYSA